MRSAATEDQVESIIAMRINGVKFRGIAEKLGLKHDTVEYVCTKYHLTRKASTLVTPKTLIDAVVERRRRNPPVPHKMIARELGITFRVSEHIWGRHGLPNPPSPIVEHEREKLRAEIAEHLAECKSDTPPPVYKSGILVWDQRPNYGLSAGD